MRLFDILVKIRIILKKTLFFSSAALSPYLIIDNTIFSIKYPYGVAVRYFIAVILYFSWWRHQMETFSALLAICAGNSPVPGEFPAQRPVTRSFDVFFDLRLNKRLSKQSRGWWIETISRPLWRHCNTLDSRDMVALIVESFFIGTGTILRQSQWQ